MTHPHVRWFEDLRRHDVDAAGGKGANLGELLAAGIPVPSGFCVTTAAYRAFLDAAAIGARLHTAFHALDATDRAAVEAAAARARSSIIEATTTPACTQAIAEAYERLGRCLVAVRSSATAEDTEEASFAGQQSTYLNVLGIDDVQRAVRACWASLFEPRAITYRARAGISHTSVSIAVPVQQMVQSERSGVAFTVDPVTGDHDRIVIEAVRGLGEALVSGEVTPDMYSVEKSSLAVIDRTHVEQQRELVYAGNSSASNEQPAPPGAPSHQAGSSPSSSRGSAPGGGVHNASIPETQPPTDHGHNTWRDLSAVLRRRPKLNDDEIAQLAQIIRRVEQHYGTPQDIEWAEAGGQFYILQSRPITTLDHAH